MNKNKTMYETKDRIKTALKKRGMTQKQLSEKTRIPKSSISQYVSGYAIPKNDRIYLISRALNVNPGWLLGYDMPMENEEIILANNPKILKVWIEAVAKDLKISEEKVSTIANDSILTSPDYPCTYTAFKNGIESINDSRESPVPYEWDVPIERPKEEIEKDSVAFKIQTLIHDYLTYDDVMRLEKLVDLTFPEEVEKYKNSRININELLERENKNEK